MSSLLQLYGQGLGPPIAGVGQILPFPLNQLIGKRNNLIPITVMRYLFLGSPGGFKGQVSALVKGKFPVNLQSKLNRKNGLIIGQIIKAHPVAGCLRHCHGHTDGIAALHIHYPVLVTVIVSGQVTRVAFVQDFVHLPKHGIPFVSRRSIPRTDNGIIGSKPFNAEALLRLLLVPRVFGCVCMDRPGTRFSKKNLADHADCQHSR